MLDVFESAGPGRFVAIWETEWDMARFLSACCGELYVSLNDLSHSLCRLELGCIELLTL